MKIIRGFSTDKGQPDTSPLRDRNGIFIEFRAGDFVHPDLWRPFSGGKWFTEPYFQTITHVCFTWFHVFAMYSLVMLLGVFASHWIFFLLPCVPGVFISWRWGNKGGYWGMKIYGVDSDKYKRWMPIAWVYDGSQATMFSIRLLATIK